MSPDAANSALGQAAGSPGCSSGKRGNPGNNPAQTATQVYRSTAAVRAAYRCRSRVRRTRLAMVRADLGEALRHASVTAQGGRQRLDAGDLVAATYLIRRLLAFATFAAACADDLEVMGAGQ
jgi:hypothetical protein